MHTYVWATAIGTIARNACPKSVHQREKGDVKHWYSALGLDSRLDPNRLVPPLDLWISRILNTLLDDGLTLRYNLVEKVTYDVE